MYNNRVTWMDFNLLAENLWRQRVTCDVDEKGWATMGFREATLDMLNLEDPLVRDLKITSRNVLKSVCILWKAIKTILACGVDESSFVLSEKEFNGITWLTAEWHGGQESERILLVEKNSADFEWLKGVCEYRLFPPVGFIQTKGKVKVDFSPTVMRAIGIGEEEVNRACLTLLVGACFEGETGAFAEVNRFGEVWFPKVCEIPNRVDREFLGRSLSILDVNMAGFWVLNKFAGGGEGLFFYESGQDGRLKCGNYLGIEKMDEALQWCCGGELRRSGETVEVKGPDGEVELKVELMEKTEIKVDVRGVKAEMERMWNDKFGVRL